MQRGPQPLQVGMSKPIITSFSSSAARLQFHILMSLFRLAFDRHLYGIFTRSLAVVFSKKNTVTILLETGKPFKVYLNDAYWTRFSLFFTDYEPEIGTVLKKAAGHSGLFCDLGANKGYWSVFAAPLFSEVQAVEASSTTYNFLSENTSEIGNVTCRKAAIFNKSNETLTFVNIHNSHASARLGETSNTLDQTETVKTISIDDLLKGGTQAVIKLDVEGAEIAAFDGANRALNDGSIVIYEDHGGDAESKPTAHLLSMPDIAVYSIEGSCTRISNVSDIASLKKDPYKGYNFLAGHSESKLLQSVLDALQSE